MSFKRLLVLSDLHCGHKAGLAPPEWHRSKSAFYKQQAEMWSFFQERTEKHKPYDICVINGDALDGKGKKSGGSELLTADRDEQALMAYECIKISEAKEYHMTTGTAYHTGAFEDFEKITARKLKATIQGQLFLDVNGTIIDFRHQVGASSIPHGANTPLSKAKLWNMVWNNYGGQPNADITIRSHTHRFVYNGDNKYLNIITPALQGFGSKFGERICSGIIHIGFIYIDIYKDHYDWGFEIMNYKTSQKNNIIISGLKK